jgi:O-antigen/teichoic acid export membrane protein
MIDAIRAQPSRMRGVTIEAGLVASGGVTDQAARLVVALVAAGVLGPVVFGYWSLIAVIIQYANVLSLGVATGAARAVPMAIGAGNERRAESIESAALAAGVATSLLAGLSAAVLAELILPAATDWLVFLLVAGAVFVQQQVILDQSLLRSRFGFHRAAAGMLAQGIVGLILGLLLLPLGIGGLLGSRILAGGAALIVGGSRRLRSRRPVWDGQVTRDLIRQGWPIALAASIFGLLITIDRWVVLALFGDRALGYFSLASMAFVGLLMIPMLVSQQHLARTAFRFGQDGDHGGLRARALRQGLIAAAITIPAAVLLVLAAVFGIPRFLPEYTASIPPMIVAAIGTSIFAVVSGYPNVLGLAGRGKRLVAVQAAGMVALAPIAIVFARAGLVLTGIALATSVVLVGYGLACAFATRSLTGSRAELPA